MQTNQVYRLYEVKNNKKEYIVSVFNKEEAEKMQKFFSRNDRTIMIENEEN